MRNGSLVILVICALVIVSYGCDGNGNNNSISPYSTGTQGVTLAFLENSPPADLYDQQTYPFSIELFNKGSYDTNPYITLSGFDKNIVHVDWTYRQPGVIYGKSINYPEGGYNYLTDNVQITLPQEVQGIPTTIMATACYDYETDATVQICIDPNPASNRDDVCEAKSFTVSGGQAAPVAITGVAQQPSPGTSQFTITIKNVGQGDVLKRDKISQCLDQLTPLDVDVVEVAGGTLGSQPIECSPTTVRLVNGQGITTCRRTGLTGSAYTTALMLKLKYGYKASITKTVSIRRI